MGEKVSGRGKRAAGSVGRHVTTFLAAGRTSDSRLGDSEVGVERGRVAAIDLGLALNGGKCEWEGQMCCRVH